MVTQSPFEGNVFISISHSGDFVQASVILEKLRDRCWKRIAYDLKFTSTNLGKG